MYGSKTQWLPLQCNLEEPVKSMAVTGFSKVKLLDLVAFLDRAEKSAAAGGA
jgi:hypothetical protein